MIADVFATALFDGAHPRDPELARALGGFQPALSGANVDQRTVLGLSPIFRGVNILGNAVAKCTPHIYRRLPGGHGGDKMRDRDHPAWRVVCQWANDWMSAAEFRDTLTAYALLRGNGIAYVERDAAGVPTEMIPLLPDRTGMAIFGRPVSEADPIPQGAEVMYWTRVGGEMRPLLPENILHIRGRSNNGVWGLDILELMRETLGLAIAARDSGARFYGQGMLASGVLYMPPNMGKGPTGEETVKNFITAVKNQVQGLGRSHKLLVIDEGAKFEKMSVDPETAQALQTREFEVRELANIVGIQPHKIGDTKRTSYASLEQANQEHLDDDVDPWLRRWEETLARVCLRENELESDSHYIGCNRKALMRTNLQARTFHYASGRQWGYYSVNDIRRAEDLDPIGEQGDSYLVPANMIPADQAEQLLPGAPSAAPAESEDTGEDEGDGNTAARVIADYQAIAQHAAERLVTRCLAEATRRAAKGGAEFVRFLNVIDGWCHEPAPLRGLLTAVGVHLAAELNKLTEPPFASADLEANVAAVIEPLRASASAVIAANLPYGKQP